MKKLFIIAITVIIASTVLVSSAYGQERLQYLAGNVTFAVGDSGVGAGKPVSIYYEPNPHERPPQTYTDSKSQYDWRFDPPEYFYKVSCRFLEGSTWYSGETIIDDTLTSDTWVDIEVQEE